MMSLQSVLQPVERLQRALQVLDDLIREHVGARQVIGVPVPLDLAFLYARKVIVGHRAKVFPATLVERAAAVEVHAAAPAARGEDSFCIDKVHVVRSGERVRLFGSVRFVSLDGGM